MSDLNELSEKVARLEEITKQNQQEIQNLKNITEEIREISINIAKLTEQMARTSEDVKDVKSEVEKIKDKPSEKWDAVTKTIATAIISGMIALAISLIFK